MQDHRHIKLKGTEVAVINKDGTPSHSSDLSQVPGWILTLIKDKGLTESYLSRRRPSQREYPPPLLPRPCDKNTAEHLPRTSGKQD
jgi:hypothetical protein